MRVGFLRALAVLVYCIYISGGIVATGFLIEATVLDTGPAGVTPAADAPSRVEPSPRSPLDDPGSLISNPATAIAQATEAIIPDWRGTERINVLLMGIDQREAQRAAGFPALTDVMLVVSIDPVAKRVAMISFPRDLWVPIPGFGYKRINEAYPSGELRRLPGGGPALAAQTIDQQFGLATNYYALVNFQAFAALVNELGGIVIDVARPIKDNAYPTEDYGIERIYFPAGPQLMDGATALKYVRTRRADSDFQRNSRQQEVLLAMRDRALRENLLPMMPTLVSTATDMVQTNLTPGEILSLAKLALQIEPAAITTLSIRAPLVVDYRGPGGAAVLLPRNREIRAAIQEALTFGDEVDVGEARTADAGRPLNTLQ